MRTNIIYTPLSAGTARAIASSTNAGPIEITTSAAHGYVTGDRITINGHTTNTAANGTWVITKVDATKFTLDGSTGNGVGGATGTAATASKIILVEDFPSIIVSFASDGGGTADLTIKAVGTDLDDSPDFAKTQTVARTFDFIDMVDLQNGTSYDGDTGMVYSSADDYRLFEVNTNALKWLSFLTTAGTAGNITVKLRAFSK